MRERERACTIFTFDERVSFVDYVKQMGEGRVRADVEYNNNYGDDDDEEDDKHTVNVHRASIHERTTTTTKKTAKRETHEMQPY